MMIPDNASVSDYIGKVIGGCRMVRLISEGGMGNVFEALHLTLNIPVALKIFPREFESRRKMLERFYKEARQAARLDHPNIVRVLDVDQDQGRHYLIMQFVDGITLQRLVDEQGPLPPNTVAGYLFQALAGLSYAHSQNVIHRDIKPDNLMLQKDGVVKITDFGLAREMGAPGRTVAGQVLGTPVYMPQEQWEDAARIDNRADLYAMGITAYYLMTAKLPYHGKTHVQILQQVIKGTRRRLQDTIPDIDPALVTIIDNLMMPERDQRYVNADAALDDLRAWLERQGLPVPQTWLVSGVGAATKGRRITTSVDRERGRADETEQDIEPSGPLLEVGTHLLHYELRHLVGQGGPREVWEAEHLGTGQTALLKIVRDARLRDRLRAEGPLLKRYMALSKHANVHSLHDVVSGHNPPFLVFEELAGLSVRDYLKEHGPIPLTDAFSVFRQILEALHAGHEQEIVHGGLSANNVFVGQGLRPMVTNWGVVPDIDPEYHPLALTFDTEESSGLRRGISSAHIPALAWFPPEVLDGADFSPRSDLYAFGMLVTMILTGFRPGFALEAQLRESRIPDPIGEYILRLLHPNPERRPASAAEALAEFTQVRLVSTLGAKAPKRASDAGEGKGSGNDVYYADTQVFEWPDGAPDVSSIQQEDPPDSYDDERH